MTFSYKFKLKYVLHSIKYLISIFMDLRFVAEMNKKTSLLQKFKLFLLTTTPTNTIQISNDRSCLLQNETRLPNNKRVSEI